MWLVLRLAHGHAVAIAEVAREALHHVHRQPVVVHGFLRNHASKAPAPSPMRAIHRGRRERTAKLCF
eukprot:COSAG06_NODE_1122_length_10628_cov_9.062684_2_plen_67_part_00